MQTVNCVIPHEVTVDYDRLGYLQSHTTFGQNIFLFTHKGRKLPTSMTNRPLAARHHGDDVNINNDVMVYRNRSLIGFILGFEVPRTMKMSVSIFWVITTCGTTYTKVSEAHTAFIFRVEV